MTVFSYIFSFLCSQDPSRSFTIGGHMLPFCQRCTGVYLGLGITFIYLLVSRHYKKGLPPRSVIYVNIVSLLVMPVFGFHFLDPGSAWRFWSGLIYGNAIAYLLLPATSIICNEYRVSQVSRLYRHFDRAKRLYRHFDRAKRLYRHFDRAKRAEKSIQTAKFHFPYSRPIYEKQYEGRVLGQYTKRSTYSFFALFAFLNTLPLWFPIQSGFFYYAVLTLALIGLLCVLFCLIAVIAFLIKRKMVLLILTLISRMKSCKPNKTC